MGNEWFRELLGDEMQVDGMQALLANELVR